MIYGIGTPKIEYKHNSYNSAWLDFTLPNNPHTVVSDYNIPDILLQKCLNGRVIKIDRGYYHKFTIDIYNITDRVLAFCEMIKGNNDTFFYPHYSDNPSFVFQINSVSAPFYVNDINGNQALRIVIDTIGYESMVEVTSEKEERES